nr:CoA pyrophosphatase [Clostridium aminobutyricum]
MQLQEIEQIFQERKAGVWGDYSYFSVMAPLVEKDGDLFLLYEVRSAGLRRQPGEVCFPGGAVEKGETKKQCAIRETCEELGLKRKDIKIISELDVLYTYSNFTMYPFLGTIPYERIDESKFSKDEVQEIFYVPLEFFLENEPYIYKMDVLPDIREDFPFEMLKVNNGYNWRKGKSQIPIYQYENWVIWGLTAIITHNLANIIRNSGRVK